MYVKEDPLKVLEGQRDCNMVGPGSPEMCFGSRVEDGYESESLEAERPVRRLWERSKEGMIRVVTVGMEAGNGWERGGAGLNGTRGRS